MDRFSLLRLPTVALKEALKCLNQIELYHLSQCSQKVAKLIPLAGTKKISLEIDFDDLKIIMNTNYVFWFHSELSNSEPDTLVFDVTYDSDTEIVARMRMLGFNVSALFKCPIKSLKFEYGISSRRCRSIIEQVLTTQDNNLENLDLICNLADEDLKWIMEKTNVTGKLRIRTNKLQSISADLNLKCRHFFLQPGYWITVDNLVSLKSCVTIQLLKTNLTYQDLDAFMKKWKCGLFPNLERLWVESYSLEDDGRILGFSEEQLSAKKGVPRKIIVDNECYGTCDRGVDVTNDDGIKGTIQIFGFDFQLFVWKD